MQHSVQPQHTCSWAPVGLQLSVPLSLLGGGLNALNPTAGKTGPVRGYLHLKNLGSKCAVAWLAHASSVGYKAQPECACFLSTSAWWCRWQNVKKLTELLLKPVQRLPLASLSDGVIPKLQNICAHVFDVGVHNGFSIFLFELAMFYCKQKMAFRSWPNKGKNGKKRELLCAGFTRARSMSEWVLLLTHRNTREKGNAFWRENVDKHCFGRTVFNPVLWLL